MTYHLATIEMFTGNPGLQTFVSKEQDLNFRAFREAYFKVSQEAQWFANRTNRFDFCTVNMINVRLTLQSIIGHWMT